MAVTHTLTKTWSDGGSTLEKSESISSGSEVNVSEDIADSTTDGLVAFVLDVSQLKMLYIHADGALTLETNSGSSPADTFTLAANAPITWSVNDGSTNPLGTDVTALYATNASGASVRLEVCALFDPTV